MTFSPQLPTVEGWYWQRAMLTDEAHPSIAFREVVHIGRRASSFFVSRAGIGGCLPIEDFVARYEWQGPLEESP